MSRLLPNASIDLQRNLIRPSPTRSHRLPSPDNGLTFIGSMANPFPNGLLDPLGPSGGLQTNLGQNISFFPKDRKMPYAQRWSFGIEREIRMGFVVEASYVGNRGTRLPV